MDTLGWMAVTCGALALAGFVTGAFALRRRRFLGTAVGLTFGLLLLTLSALFATIGVATQGYRALTHEELAATVLVRPAGPRRFVADFTFPDGRRESFDLAGDQLYVDAHILKWKPLANILGLHTGYELDRVGGRYMVLQDERDSLRTVHSLKQGKPVDMFALRQRFAIFRPLLDAEYGSATFIAADEPARLEVLVSTTGLLIRRITP